jgi:hypothetical protein
MCQAAIISTGKLQSYSPCPRPFPQPHRASPPSSMPFPPLKPGSSSATPFPPAVLALPHRIQQHDVIPARSPRLPPPARSYPRSRIAMPMPPPTHPSWQPVPCMSSPSAVISAAAPSRLFPLEPRSRPLPRPTASPPLAPPRVVDLAPSLLTKAAKTLVPPPGIQQPQPQPCHGTSAQVAAAASVEADYHG